MKWVILSINLLIFIHYGYSEMSEKQLKATQKLVRNTCQSKAKASSEELDAMRAGNFEQGKTAQLTKDGNFDWETGVKTIKSVAPERVAGPGSESIKNCKDAMVTKDNKCMGALEIAKCLYDDNPQNYFLP